jgi:hypothetical protein
MTTARSGRPQSRPQPPAGPAYPQTMTGLSFPRLAARDLDGREVMLPAGCPANGMSSSLPSGASSKNWSSRGCPGWRSARP